MAGVVQRHHDAAGDRRTGRVERVAAEDAGNAAQYDVTDHTAADGGDRPEQDGGQPAEPAAEPGDDRENGEPDRIQPFLPGDQAGQQGVAEESGSDPAFAATR